MRVAAGALALLACGWLAACGDSTPMNPPAPPEPPTAEAGSDVTPVKGDLGGPVNHPGFGEHAHEAEPEPTPLAGDLGGPVEHLGYGARERAEAPSADPARPYAGARIVARHLQLNGPWAPAQETAKVYVACPPGEVQNAGADANARPCVRR